MECVHTCPGTCTDLGAASLLPLGSSPLLHIGTARGAASRPEAAHLIMAVHEKKTPAAIFSRPLALLAALPIVLLCTRWCLSSLPSTVTPLPAAPMPPAPSAPPAPRPASVAVAVKTCSAYHGSRLRAMMSAWGARSKMRAFSTDGPVTDGPKGVRANETIIVGDLRMVALRKDTPAEHVHLGNSGEPIALEEADSVRPEAYMASWRKEHGSDGPALGKQTEPALTRRVAKGLEVLYDAFHERAEWFLIVDDDTFVRWGPLRAYLATLDPDKPQILGSPMDSSKMLSPEGRARGASVHCGGGAGWILSRAALAVLRPRLSECLSQREVVKTWCVRALPPRSDATGSAR